MSKITKSAGFDVFISYSRPNQSVAEELYELLAREASTFLDIRSLRFGDDWDRASARAQRDAKVSAILISKATEPVFYSREEVASAIVMARQDSSRVARSVSWANLAICGMVYDSPRNSTIIAPDTSLNCWPSFVSSVFRGTFSSRKMFTSAARSRSMTS